MLKDLFFYSQFWHTFTSTFHTDFSLLLFTVLFYLQSIPKVLRLISLPLCVVSHDCIFYLWQVFALHEWLRHQSASYFYNFHFYYDLSIV